MSCVFFAWAINVYVSVPSKYLITIPDKSMKVPGTRQNDCVERHSGRIRTFVAEARWIPSESMVPTLQKYDKLIVDKLSYHFTSPQRGDIVVFSYRQY